MSINETITLTNSLFLMELSVLKETGAVLQELIAKCITETS